MQDKQQKGGFLGFLSNVFNWCINIIAIVLCPPLAIIVIEDASERGVNMASLDILKETVTYANNKLGKPFGTLAIVAATVRCSGLLQGFFLHSCCGLAAAARLWFCSRHCPVGYLLRQWSHPSNCLMAIGIPETAATITAMVIGVVISIVIENHPHRPY